MRCPFPARLLPALLALCTALAPFGAPHAAEPPRVVASIAPIHSLVAAVTRGVTRPHLLVPAGQSPHTFALAPSDARALAHADLVVAAGGPVDRFLERPLSALAADAPVLRLLDTAGVQRLAPRDGGAWPPGGRNGATESDEHEQGHDHEHATGEHAVDPHAWLAPPNAIAFTRAIADRLAALDPARAERYRANADERIAALTALDRHLATRLALVADRPYLVFHDAYQYLERHYGLAPAGSIAVDAGRPPGARRLLELRDRIRQRGIECLFVEPQFEPGIAHSIAEGTGARIQELDPLGAALEPGPELYPALLTQLAESLRQCLQASAPSD